MAGANGGWAPPATLQVASNLLRSISPTASTIRWMMSSSSSHSIMSTGRRKRCRRSGGRKKWAIDPHLGSMAPRESRPPPQRHYLLMPRGHQFAVRYGNRLHGDDNRRLVESHTVPVLLQSLCRRWGLQSRLWRPPAFGLEGRADPAWL